MLRAAFDRYDILACRPNVVARECDNAHKDRIGRVAVEDWSGDDVPPRAIPMLSERAQAPRGADRPDVVRSHCRHPKQDVIANAIWARNNAPVRAVPMNGQGLRFLQRSANSPDVVRSQCVNRKKKVVIKHRAGHDTPGGAIPVQSEGKAIKGAGIGRITNRPNVIGGDDCDRLENVAKAGRVWARNNTPDGAIPMFDQGAINAAVCRLANRPYVISRDHSDAVEKVVAIRRIRAPDQGPARAIPMLDLGAISVQLLIKRPADSPQIIIGGDGDGDQ